MNILTLISRVSLTGLPLCDQVKLGVGSPEISHSNFIFCPALAITFDKGDINCGASAGCNAKIYKKKLLRRASHIPTQIIK